MGDDTRAKLKSLGEARQRVYAFLSNAFCHPPSCNCLESLQDESFVTAMSQLLDDQTTAPLRQYAEAVERTAELERQAQQEFMSLFKVPGGQYVAPYESAFRDSRDVAGRRVDGLLMGQCASDVRKYYTLAAFDVPEEWQDFPDHVYLEFAFLAHLCGKERAFAEAESDARLTEIWKLEHGFLVTHVVSWMAALHDRLFDKSQHTYFRAIADLAVEFTHRDLAALEDVLGSPGNTSVPP